MKTKITPPFAALGMLCAIIMPSQAAIIVTENFAGAGQLKFASVDFFSPDIVAAGGTAAWSSADQFWKTGAVIRTGANQNRNAVLNLGSYINNAKGTSDGLFELTATIGPMTEGSFLSVGFSNATTSGSTVTFAGRGGLGTMVYRTNGDIDQYAGSGDTNEVAAANTTYTGARTLTITLDLRDYNVINSNFGSVSFRDSVAGLFGSFDYTVANKFNSIMLSTANSIGPVGTYSNLTLTQIPEPSTALLGGLGLLALLRRRR